MLLNFQITKCIENVKYPTLIERDKLGLVVNTLGSATLSIRKFRIGITSLNIVYPLLLIYALIALVAPTWCTLSCSQDKLLKETKLELFTAGTVTRQVTTLLIRSSN